MSEEEGTRRQVATAAPTRQITFPTRRPPTLPSPDDDPPTIPSDVPVLTTSERKALACERARRERREREERAGGSGGVRRTMSASRGAQFIIKGTLHIVQHYLPICLASFAIFSGCRSISLSRPSDFIQQLLCHVLVYEYLPTIGQIRASLTVTYRNITLLRIRL